MKPSADEFERLALDQADMLYRVACRLTRNRDGASDLVQETYLRAFRARDGFDLQQHGIRPWLIRIMQNLHLSRADRERRQPMALDEAALDAAAPANTNAEVLAFGGAGFENMDQRLVQALNQLPSEYQVVMLLWAVEEFSYKEIAEAVNVPIGTVMSRLHRARQRLAQTLHDFALKTGVIRE